jgi:hypothetical protein
MRLFSFHPQASDVGKTHRFRSDYSTNVSWKHTVCIFIIPEDGDSLLPVTLVSKHKLTRSCNAEDFHRHLHRCEKLTISQSEICVNVWLYLFHVIHWDIGLFWLMHVTLPNSSIEVFATRCKQTVLAMKFVRGFYVLIPEIWNWLQVWANFIT